MKILQVSHSFYPCFEAGGVVKVCYEISRALVKRGHQVTVVTTDGCSRRLNIKTNCDLNVEGIHVWYFRNISNYLRTKLKIASPYFLPLYLKKNIRDFNVIHIHEHRTILAVLVNYYAKKYKIPYIIQAHGDLPADYGKKTLKKLFDFCFGKKILKNAAKVIALTPYECKQYMDAGVPRERIEIIPNGFDFYNVPFPVEKGTFKKKYGIEFNQKIILFLGRINEIKGIDLLIESFSEVSKEIKDCVLVIIGPDDGFLPVLKRQIFKLKIQNRVFFTGPVYGNEKFYAYRDADVFVLPSLYEAFPNTVLEAWACGTPVIITDSCALSSLAQEVAIVVRRQSHDLARAIKLLILNERLRGEISKKGQSLVYNEFNIETVITKLEECYHKAIQEKNMDLNQKTKKRK